MSEHKNYHARIRQVEGFRFEVTFDGHPSKITITVDEPPPLGSGDGPNAAQLLGAATVNCLASSLLLCLHKTHASVSGMSGSVTTKTAKDEAGRFRITGIDVHLVPAIGDSDAGRLQRCRGLCEDYCIVTNSLRKGVPIDVTVEAPTEESGKRG